MVHRQPHRQYGRCRYSQYDWWRGELHGVATQFQNNWGSNGTAIINIANSTLTATNANINLNQSNNATNFGEINLLTGGTLQANSIAPNANGTKLVNFNGGTLKASGATATFITTNNTG